MDARDLMVSSAIYTANGPIPPTRSSSALDGQFPPVSPDVDEVGVSTGRPDPPPIECILGEFVCWLIVSGNGAAYGPPRHRHLCRRWDVWSSWLQST